MFGGQDASAFPRDGRTVEERTRSKQWKQRVSTSRSQLSQWQGDRQQGSARPYPMASLVGAGQDPSYSRQGLGKNSGITEVRAKPNRIEIDIIGGGGGSVEVRFWRTAVS